MEPGVRPNDAFEGFGVVEKSMLKFELPHEPNWSCGAGLHMRGGTCAVGARAVEGAVDE